METAQNRQRCEAFFNSAVPAAAWAESPLFHLPGFPEMQERCAICDLKLSGNRLLLGAMYISYGLGVLIMAPIAALLWL